MQNYSLDRNLKSIVHDAKSPLAALQILLIQISKQIPEFQYNLMNNTVNDLDKIFQRLELYIANNPC